MSLLEQLQQAEAYSAGRIIDDEPPELDFEIVDHGFSGQFSAVVTSKNDGLPSIRPISTLPAGLAPLLPDLRDELEEILLRPEDIPIHHYQRAQKFWPRERNPDQLFRTQMIGNPFELMFDRDPKTGELIETREVLSDATSLDAQNSMLMTRKPGSVFDPVKGNSSSTPFWPGGISMPAPSSDSLDFDFTTNPLENLKTGGELFARPPGFTYDVILDEAPVHIETEDSALKEADEAAADNLITSADMSADMSAAEIAVSVRTVADIFSDDIQLPELPATYRQDSISSDYDRLSSEEGTRTDSPVIIDDADELPIDMLKIEEKKTAPEKPAEKQWAILDDLNDVKDFHKLVPEMAFEYPFEIDPFQKRAVLHLERHENVLVAAHTSAGKTVVAEYAIALSMKHMRRAVYTSPIKALSNQKFRDFKNTFPDVGLLTGDVQIKPEAPCLIMTTEILRSMLYNGSDVIRDLEWVIFDEIHYINDAERGVVWEEVLIMLPSHIGIILLSATVPNTLEFASWIGRTKQKEVYVVQTKKRPVPLEHYLFTGNCNKTSSEVFLLLDRHGRFCTEGYRAACKAKKDRASAKDEMYGAKGTRQGKPQQDRAVWQSVIQMLKKKDQLPVVAFTLSKKKCDQNAEYFRSTELVTSSEKSHITTFFNKCVAKLKGLDRQLPQVLWMGNLLKNGLGVHHSGILPILKEVVEMLFQKGLVKLLFATETFAMGVNMPARTVVFDNTKKFDGKNFRDLLSSEYIQMAGRAGRRGLDTTGMCVILCKGDVQESSELHAMMLGTPTKLSSQFRLTYFMILNLLRVRELTVQDMMKRSFSEYYLQKDAPENEQKLEDLRQQVEQLEEPRCGVCSYDLKEYYLHWAEVLQLQQNVKAYIFGSPHGQKAMCAGRLVVVTNGNHSNALAVVLQHGSIDTSLKYSSVQQEPLDKLYTLLVLCTREYQDSKQFPPQQTSGKKAPLRSENAASVSTGGHPFSDTKLFCPDGQASQVVEEVKAGDIYQMCNKQVKIEADKIIDNHKKRQIPRYKMEEPSRSVILAGQQLLQLAIENPTGLPELSPVKDMGLNQIDFVDKVMRLDSLQIRLNQFDCTQCANFMEHFSVMRANMQVRDNVTLLEHSLSDASLTLIEEYNQRIEVLKQLDYVDRDENLQQKGRLAFEVGNNEMMITELIINNILTEKKPEEILALLSCFVFEQKTSCEPRMNDSLVKGVEQIKETARRLAMAQKQCGIDVTVEESLADLKFGLVEVVYEWARGMPFKDIMELTDVSEGQIVRCIQRLDETCRDVRKAASVIGVQALCEKMEDGMSLIRRDIVFAASLYTSS